MSAVVHIGVPRTGTTTLQRHVFPYLPGCVFVHQTTHKEFEPLAGSLCNADDDHYREDAVREFLEDVQDGHGGTLLISREGFSGSLSPDTFHQGRTAERLYRLLPGAKILVVVRNQAGLLRSLYGYYLTSGGHATFADVLTGREPRFTLDLEFLHFDRLVTLYQQLFGIRGAKVLPYELLVEDPARYIEEVCSFIGADPSALPADAVAQAPNRSPSAATSWVLRKHNRLFRRSRYNPRPALGHLRIEKRVRNVIRSIDERLPVARRSQPPAAEHAALGRILRSYAEENARLAERVGLDLERYGYPLPR